ncbi:glucose-1-phosphate cytidylyltransferase [Mucilaginibacter rubeus]|jgi:glucose-1-phosphate cytidylyltransferase|nr:glucose-1-phosphate cytidylyltransferase [Mucilaginibacter rubeus]
MKIYSHYGFTDFVVCLGYKGYLIKEYFANYYLHKSNVTINLANNDVKVHDTQAEPWNITLVDTGLETMTGGRLKRVKEYLNGEPFMLTYGDGVADIDVNELVAFHESHGKLITLTSVQPEGRFGLINFDDSQKILSFQEKPKGDGGWSNGGFFVCQPEVIDYLEDDTTIFERAPLENLAKDGQLFAYKHHGFWKPMDTVRDKAQLEEMIASGTASWIKW